MVKSIHIGHRYVLFIGEQVDVWFKISLLHLVPGTPSSLCLARCYCRTRPKLQKKPPKALCVGLWGYLDTHTHTLSLLTYCLLPPARKPPLIAHTPVLLPCMHISLRMCSSSTTTESLDVFRVAWLCVCPCFAGSGLWLCQLDSCRFWCWCAEQSLLRGVIRYHLFQVQCLVPCRVEPLAQVTTSYWTSFLSDWTLFSQVSHFMVCFPFPSRPVCCPPPCSPISLFSGFFWQQTTGIICLLGHLLLRQLILIFIIFATYITLSHLQIYPF